MSDREIRVASKVPYGSCISGWLQMQPDQMAKSLVNDSCQFERHFLAWETVRKGRNPYFQNATGFEGYLVGCCQTSDEALERILSLSHNMLIGAYRLHRFDPRFQSRLRKTLTGEMEDPEAMSEWAAQFGAALARLRCNVFCNRQTEKFQSDTHRLVDWLPPINYLSHDGSIDQLYVLDFPPMAGSNKTFVDPYTLKACDQEAWLLAQSIGKFGHPLVREFLRCGLSPDHVAG